MVTMSRQRELLQWELAETERLMESIGGHPFMSISYREKIKRLKEQIAQLPPLGVKESNAVLYFSGDPVVGSMGIDSQFAAEVISPFQNMVKEEYSSRLHGRNGKRGKIKDSKESRMLLVGLPRGSFGLEFVKAEQVNLLDDVQLGESLSSLIGLIKSASESDDSFVDTLEHTDSRVMNSLKEFLRIVSSNKAGLKFESGDSWCELTPKQAKTAYGRVANTSQTQETIVVEGVFKGVLLDSRKFEFLDEKGYKISGSLCTDIDDSAMARFNVNFTNKRCHVQLDRYVIKKKNGTETVRYCLVKLSSLS